MKLYLLQDSLWYINPHLFAYLRLLCCLHLSASVHVPQVFQEAEIFSLRSIPETRIFLDVRVFSEYESLSTRCFQLCIPWPESCKCLVPRFVLCKHPQWTTCVPLLDRPLRRRLKSSRIRYTRDRQHAKRLRSFTKCS